MSDLLTTDAHKMKNITFLKIMCIPWWMVVGTLKHFHPKNASPASFVQVLQSVQPMAYYVMRKTFLRASILFAACSIIVHVLLYIEVSTLITYLYYICSYISYSLKMLYSMDLYFGQCTLFLSLLHCARVPTVTLHSCCIQCVCPE